MKIIMFGVWCTIGFLVAGIVGVAWAIGLYLVVRFLASALDKYTNANY